MPPKPKFSKEEIIDAALDIVSRDGVAALTARELGEKLGCSSSPIFTVFKSMDEVMQAIRIEAMRRYDEYVSRARDYYPSFKAIGILMLRYAKEQPKLFQLLFMAENAQARRFDDVFDTLGETAKLSIEFVMNDYGLTTDEAHFLFQYVWTFTYGVSAMSATGMCDFSCQYARKRVHGRHELYKVRHARQHHNRHPTGKARWSRRRCAQHPEL